MRTIYRIQPIDEKSPTLFINPDTADRLGISRKKYMILSFGSSRVFAEVSHSRELSETELRLSGTLISDLHLPVYLELEIYVAQNEMMLGPCIGMLMSKKFKNITASFLEKMKIYVKSYNELHGAIVVFALDKIDTNGKLVEGYCYNPVSRNFEKGIFPLPCSMYRSIGLSDHWKSFFLSVLGDRVFNNHYFNKWDMYQWFSGKADINIQIPFTSVYKATQDVFDSLEKFNKVYIKPVAGLRGHGVIQVARENGTYVFRYREDGVNLRKVMQNKDQADEYIRDKFAHGRYLIQQAIELIQFRGGVVDFRCIMQKDQSKEWVCKAIIGRYGERDSVVSNISSGGRAFKINKINKIALPLSDEKIAHLDDEISFSALQVCRALDEYGLNCGTLGLDIGVDNKENLWLIEINNRDPDPSIALNVRDWSLYKNLKTGVLLYAKSLAGFAPV